MFLNQLLDVSLLKQHIENGYVDEAFHPEFPLVLYTYSRKTVAEQLWDDVTVKTRGLIVNKDTGVIIARPFFKFFNYGDPLAGLQLAGRTVDEPAPGNACIFREPDTLYEKVDGFMCTMYRWDGREYIASKGSFDSPHAKWATATYNQILPHGGTWPVGYTPVFEGVTKNLRIVVDYGDREELVLIGLVNIETGEELSQISLMTWATANGFASPRVFTMSLKDAAEAALNPMVKNEEGFVAYWFRLGQTPFRLKIKYQDYLRIHRLVTGVSPRRVYEALVNGWTSELDEWSNESTPWFNHFIQKWRSALETEAMRISHTGDAVFGEIVGRAMGSETFWTRKQWAEEFKKHPEELHSILFAKLDGKDVKPFVWKRIKPMISGSRPMIDASKL